MAIAYDRRVPVELLGALVKGGFAHSLVEYGKAGQYALDLQLRGYAAKSGHWATLYVGLTKVLDLRYSSKGFRLGAHKTYREGKFGWQRSWENTQPGERLAERWSEVEDYLERVIPQIGSKFLKEGSVQAAISGYEREGVVIIDREAAVTFSNQREKDRISRRLSKPLLEAISASNGNAWWKSRPRSLGGECDLLGVTRLGELLAIEVKPARDTTKIAWSPVQVRHYANLFQEWADTAPNAPAVLQGMIDQRARLGLNKRLTVKFGSRVQVRPVVAVARGSSNAAKARLAEVHQRLVEAEINEPALEVEEVTIAGRPDALELGGISRADL